MRVRSPDQGQRGIGRARAIWSMVRARIGRRQLLLPLIVAVELLLLFAVGWQRAAPPVATSPAGAIRMFDLTAERPAPPAPAPPPVPAEIIVPPPVIVTPAPAPIPVTIAPLPPALASPGAAGPACDVNGPMHAALRAEPAIARAVAAIPQRQRSVANAVQVWNGEWVAPDRVGGAAIIEGVRGVVARTLAGLPPACRDQARSGPAFFLIAAGGQDAAIVIGSGRWSWAQLLVPDVAAAPPVGE